MPVTPGRALLWFSNAAEEERYDDMMMANIEFKSDDSENEDYAMVFTRQRKEKFFKWSDLALKEIAAVNARNAETPDNKHKRYAYKGGEATFNKTWTLEKRILGFGFGYLILRELPIRNFYARGWVMFWFFAKFWDQYGLPVPYSNRWSRPVCAKVDDLWEGARDIECFNVQKKVLTKFDMPTPNNRLAPSTEWWSAQPGHMIDETALSPMKYLSVFSRRYKEAPWDGTFNMPLNSLAHPLHKDVSHLQWSSQQH